MLLYERYCAPEKKRETICGHEMGFDTGLGGDVVSRRGIARAPPVSPQGSSLLILGPFCGFISTLFGKSPGK
jgi:hypothetical protein